MHHFLKENKVDIEKLEKLTNKSLFRIFDVETNDVNYYSKLSEIRFGLLLMKLTNQISYEPKVNGLTPDWLVEINNEKIIFEVIRINPNEEFLKIQIDNYQENNFKFENNFELSSSGIFKDFYKILKKEKKYRNLIEDDGYKLIICVDASSFIKSIDINDFVIFFNFVKESNLYKIEGYNKFFKNVSGLIVLPYMGGMTYLHNKDLINQIDNLFIPYLNIHTF